MPDLASDSKCLADWPAALPAVNWRSEDNVQTGSIGLSGEDHWLWQTLWYVYRLACQPGRYGLNPTIRDYNISDIHLYEPEVLWRNSSLHSLSMLCCVWQDLRICLCNWWNWWLLVVSENLPLFGHSTAYKPITYKILFRETNPRRDKNETEPQENKIKNALLRISASEYLLFRCKGTNLSRQKRIKTHKVHIYSVFFIFLYHGG